MVVDPAARLVTTDHLEPRAELAVEEARGQATEAPFSLLLGGDRDRERDGEEADVLDARAPDEKLRVGDEGLTDLGPVAPLGLAGEIAVGGHKLLRLVVCLSR